MTTIYDIAREAGVSKSTVSRVLNGSKSVSPEKQARIDRAIQALHYSPNTVARALVPNVAYRSVMVVSLRPAAKALDNPYFSNVVFAISSVTEMHDFDIFFQTGDSPENVMANIKKKVTDQLIQGVILLSVPSDDGFLTSLNQCGVPVVAIGAVPAQFDNIFSVDTDNYHDAYHLTSILIEAGRKSLRCVHAPLSLAVSRARVKGFEDSLKDHGITIGNDSLIDGGFTMESSRKAINELFSSDKGFDGLLTTDDLKLIASLDAARKDHIHIPKQLSVAGFSNSLINELLPIKPTSVSIPTSRLGRVAADTLFQLIDQDEQGIDISKTQIVKPDFEPGESV